MLSEDAPLRHSKLELRAARKAFEEMQAAKNLEEFAIAWRIFLVNLEKVWVKVERECQPFRNRFQPWQGPVTSLRKKDELLRYLYQARHVDQHSIQPMTQEVLGVLQLTIPPLGTAQLHFDKEKQTLTISGECHSLVTRGPGGYLLFPIENRGKIYAPPTEHLGTKLPLPDAAIVGRSGAHVLRGLHEAGRSRVLPTAAVRRQCGGLTPGTGLHHGERPPFPAPIPKTAPKSLESLKNPSEQPIGALAQT